MFDWLSCSFSLGKKYLYGSLWLSILRLPRTRVAAYACLAKLFKKNDMVIPSAEEEESTMK